MALDYLKEYGNTFQIKIISNLLKSKGDEFISQVMDILSPDFFESDANQWIISKIIDYYKIYNVSPTIEYFKTQLVTTDEITREAVKQNIKECYNYIQNSTDLDYVRNEFLEFCQNQTMKNAIMQSVNLIKEKKYTDIKVLVDNALKFGNTKRDIGHVYEDMIEDRVVKNPRVNVVSTEWSVINEITDGGAGAGDLFILIGGAGAGKCVGPNTKINVKYDEIGLEDDDGNIIYYKPWEDVIINGKKYKASEISGLPEQEKVNIF